MIYQPRWLVGLLNIIRWKTPSTLSNMSSQHPCANSLHHSIRPRYTHSQSPCYIRRHSACCFRQKDRYNSLLLFPYLWPSKIHCQMSFCSILYPSQGFAIQYTAFVHQASLAHAFNLLRLSEVSENVTGTSHDLYTNAGFWIWGGGPNTSSTSTIQQHKLDTISAYNWLCTHSTVTQLSLISWEGMLDDSRISCLARGLTRQAC